MHPEKAAAIANRDGKRLDDTHNLIVHTCDEILAGHT